MKPLLTIVCCALAAAASAQNTLIVDSRGGPGVFLDLAPAVAAASPGDTILVVYTWTSPNTTRYHGAVIDKSLRIIGVSEVGLPLDPGMAPFVDRIEVRNIPAGGEVLLAYLGMTARADPNPPYTPFPHGLVLQNCLGKVHIESVTYGNPLMGSCEIRFEDCADLSLHWCHLDQAGPSILLRRSNVAISESSFSPIYPFATTCSEPICVDRTSPTLHIEDSTVRLVDSSVVGAGRWTYWLGGLQPARNAVELVNSTLLVGPNTALNGGANFGVPVDGVAGTGTVILDPLGTHTGIQSSALVLNQRVETVSMERAIRNQPFQVVVMGPPNGYALLAMGLPLHQGIVFPFGTLRLDPLAMGVLGLGALDQQGALQQHYRVPALAPMDLLLALQAGTLSPNGVLGLTHPSVFSIAWEGGRSWP